MSDDSAPVGDTPTRPRVTIALLVRLWLGVLAFGLLNIPFILIVASLDSGSGAPALFRATIMALLVAGVATLCWFVFGWRRFTAGFLAGYVLMTIVSGGACTLFVEGSGFEGGLITGVVLYPLAVIVFGIALGIAAVVAARRA